VNLLELLKNEKLISYIIISGLLIVIFAIISFLWLDYNVTFSNQINAEKFAYFGDFIGGVAGSFWALAGVFLFYKALTEQRKDFVTNKKALDAQVEALQAQIKEFEAQRKELSQSRKIYEDQSKTLKVQQFESSFYSFFEIYLKIKEKLVNLDKSTDHFEEIFMEVISCYEKGKTIFDNHDIMVKKYEDIFEKKRGYLSHYFKAFYRLIKMIDNSGNLEDKNKIFYSKIIRSQLTDYEQLVLYYNSHTNYGVKARPLLLKYNLLKHVPIFKKPEFSSIYNSDPIILKLTNELNSFLTKHINASYELEVDNPNAEEEVICYSDCIIAIYFNDNDIINLKIICSNDISNNGFRITDDQLYEFLYNYVSDKLIMSTYINKKLISITKSKKETEEQKIFAVKIETKEKLILIQE